MPLPRSFRDASRSLEGFFHQSGASWVEVLSAEWEEVLEGASHTSCGEHFNYRLSCGNEVLVGGVCGSLSSKLFRLGSSRPSRVSGKASLSRTPSLTPTFGLQLRSFPLFPYSLLSSLCSFVFRFRTPRLLYWRLLSRARI